MSSRDAEGLVTVCRSDEVCTGLKSSMCLLQNYREVSYLQAEKGLVKCRQLNILIPSSHPAGWSPKSRSGST